jgi:hypothetical protein
LIDISRVVTQGELAYLGRMQRQGTMRRWHPGCTQIEFPTNRHLGPLVLLIWYFEQQDLGAVVAHLACALRGGWILVEIRLQF